MNKEEIMKLAISAGASQLSNVPGFEDFLVHFFILAGEVEREACAQLVDHLLCEGGGTYGDAIRRRSE